MHFNEQGTGGRDIDSSGSEGYCCTSTYVFAASTAPLLYMCTTLTILLLVYPAPSCCQKVYFVHGSYKFFRIPPPPHVEHLLRNNMCCARQWSWPLPLPVQFFGIFPTGGTITEDDQELPWSDELEHKIFISAIGKLFSPPVLYLLSVCLHAVPHMVLPLSPQTYIHPDWVPLIHYAYACELVAHAYALANT